MSRLTSPVVARPSAVRSSGGWMRTRRVLNKNVSSSRDLLKCPGRGSAGSGIVMKTFAGGIGAHRSSECQAR